MASLHSIHYLSLHRITKDIRNLLSTWGFFHFSSWSFFLQRLAGADAPRLAGREISHSIPSVVPWLLGFWCCVPCRNSSRKRKTKLIWSSFYLRLKKKKEATWSCQTDASNSALRASVGGPTALWRAAGPFCPEIKKQSVRPKRETAHKRITYW